MEKATATRRVPNQKAVREEAAPPAPEAEVSTDNRVATYTDAFNGARYKVLVPAAASDSHLAMGLRLGPPDAILDASRLDLPPNLAVRLHNQLHDRGILTWSDARHRRQELFAALMAALSVDVETILDIYYQASVSASQEDKGNI